MNNDKAIRDVWRQPYKIIKRRHFFSMIADVDFIKIRLGSVKQVLQGRAAGKYKIFTVGFFPFPFFFFSANEDKCSSLVPRRVLTRTSVFLRSLHENNCFLAPPDLPASTFITRKHKSYVSFKTLCVRVCVPCTYIITKYSLWLHRRLRELSGSLVLGGRVPGEGRRRRWGGRTRFHGLLSLYCARFRWLYLSKLMHIPNKPKKSSTSAAIVSFMLPEQWCLVTVGKVVAAVSNVQLFYGAIGAINTTSQH